MWTQDEGKNNTRKIITLETVLEYFFKIDIRNNNKPMLDTEIVKNTEASNILGDSPSHHKSKKKNKKRFNHLLYVHLNYQYVNTRY